MHSSELENPNPDDFENAGYGSDNCGLSGSTDSSLAFRSRSSGNVADPGAFLPLDPGSGKGK